MCAVDADRSGHRPVFILGDLRRDKYVRGIACRNERGRRYMCACRLRVEVEQCSQVSMSS